MIETIFAFCGGFVIGTWYGIFLVALMILQKDDDTP